MNKNIKIGVYVLAVVILGGLVAGLLWYQGVFGTSEHGLFLAVKDRSDLRVYFDQIDKDKKKIKEDPDKAGAYLDLGLAWKSLGDLSSKRQNAFYKKSLAAYAEGIERFGSKNILFYLNDGKVAELMGDFSRAERDYKQAIAISPHDDSGYIYLASLYDYKLHRSKEDILAVYKEGIIQLTNPINLIVDRASYLRRIGDYAAALPDYEILVKNYPSNQGYKNVVAELQKKIADQK